MSRGEQQVPIFDPGAASTPDAPSIDSVLPQKIVNSESVNAPKNDSENSIPIPEAPEAGSLIKFIETGYEIKAMEGSRPGLPNVFDLVNAAGRLICHGSFPAVLATAVKSSPDGVLGAWHSGEQERFGLGHLNLGEQRPQGSGLPQVQHGYAHRKRRG
jgi:hypothetical protein